MLYIICHDLFYSWKFVHLTSIQLFCPVPQPSPLWQSPVCSLYLWIYFCSVLVFLPSHESKHTQYLSFSVWLISQCIIPSISIHVVTNGKISFFFLWLTIFYCVSHIFFIHSSINISGHLGCFCIMSIVNNTTMNISVQKSFLKQCFHFLWVITQR